MSLRETEREYIARLEREIEGLHKILAARAEPGGERIEAAIHCVGCGTLTTRYVPGGRCVERCAEP